MAQNWIPGDRYELTANKNYWRGAPKVDKVVIRQIPEAATRVSALISGEVQIVEEVPVDIIAEIEAGGRNDEFYDAKIKVLSEMIEHHVKEEEKPAGLFSQARKAGVDMKTLGEKLAAEKKQLVASFKEDGLPTPETSTLSGTKLAR